MLSRAVQPSVRLSSAHLQRQFLTVIDDNVSPLFPSPPVGVSPCHRLAGGKEGGGIIGMERGDSIENNGS